MRAVLLENIGDFMKLSDVDPEIPIQGWPVDEAMILVLLNAVEDSNSFARPTSAVLLSESDFECSEFAVTCQPGEDDRIDKDRPMSIEEAYEAR